jgi:GxxExxY protein
MKLVPPGDLKHSDLTGKIIGVFYSVYNELGHGFLESVYEEAMTIALREAGIKVQRQLPVPVWFRGQKVGDFKADMLVEEAVLLELKCVRVFEPVHEAQLLHYLKSTEIEVGLLLNFGPSAQFRRLVFANERKTIRVNPRKSAAKVPA